MPATSGILITSGDTGAVTNLMLAGSIADSKLFTDNYCKDKSCGEINRFYCLH
jgi:hypothetical protein